MCAPFWLGPEVFYSQSCTHWAFRNSSIIGKFSYTDVDSCGSFCSWICALVRHDSLFSPDSPILGAVVCHVSSTLLWIWEELNFYSAQLFTCFTDRVSTSKILICGTRNQKQQYSNFYFFFFLMFRTLLIE